MAGDYTVSTAGDYTVSTAGDYTRCLWPVTTHGDYGW